MIIGIYLILILLTYLLLRATILDEDRVIDTLLVILGAFSILMVAVSAKEILKHSKDIGVVRTYKMAVTSYEQRAKRTRKTIRGLVNTLNTGQLVNNDAPVKALIETAAMLEKDIAKKEMSYIQARSNIEARKAGMWWFIVSIYGEE